MDVTKWLKFSDTRARTRAVAHDLINLLHNADGRGKEYFPPRGA
jgi:hypothetical protein